MEITVKKRHRFKFLFISGFILGLISIISFLMMITGIIWCTVEENTAFCFMFTILIFAICPFLLFFLSAVGIFLTK